MNRRTRVVVFDGGLLEVADYEDTDNDGSVYLEMRTLPQRVPGAAELNSPGTAVEPAEAELCGRVLRLLRDLP
ncbi:hypothetical protein AB0M45_32770 [Nocardia sp. NPDC051787]|uniref:hypothetical protein n=1 Tax=Nocardia sp. NPDC051787 TaxID=3155415 RepID=UPI0034227E5B